MLPSYDILDNDGEWDPEDLSDMILDCRVYDLQEVGNPVSFWCRKLSAHQKLGVLS